MVKLRRSIQDEIDRSNLSFGILDTRSIHARKNTLLIPSSQASTSQEVSKANQAVQASFTIDESVKIHSARLPNQKVLKRATTAKLLGVRADKNAGRRLFIPTLDFKHQTPSVSRKVVENPQFLLKAQSLGVLPTQKRPQSCQPTLCRSKSWRPISSALNKLRLVPNGPQPTKAACSHRDLQSAVPLLSTAQPRKKAS